MTQHKSLLFPLTQFWHKDLRSRGNQSVYFHVTVSEFSKKKKVHSGEEIMIRKVLTRFEPMVQL